MPFVINYEGTLDIHMLFLKSKKFTQKIKVKQTLTSAIMKKILIKPRNKIHHTYHTHQKVT